MSSAKTTGKVPGLIRNVHFWLGLALLAGLTLLHYIEQLGIVDTVSPSLHFGLERHAMDRILFLLPIVYMLFVFGVTAGLVTTAAALLLMLPRALLASPHPRDALFEVICIMLIAVTFCLWYRARLRATLQRRQATAELNTMQKELQSHIRLARSNEIRLAMLNSISGMLTHSLEIESLLRNAMDMVMDVMEAEAVRLFSLDTKSGELNLMAWKGVSDRFAHQTRRLRLGEGFNGRVARTGEPLQVEDISRESEVTIEALMQEKIKSQLIVPLKAKDQITGTLCVANRHTRKFLPQEVQLLVAIGNQIAIAIENARLYREQQETAVQYRGIFENASDAIWAQDLGGNILTANEATAKLTGYTAEELLGMKAGTFGSEYEERFVKEMQNRLIRGDVVDEPYELKLTRKDGTEVLLRLTPNLIISDGKPVGIQYIARDVTKEKRMEENLRFYIEQITKAQEEERRRISHELHDETAQQLIALSNQLEDFSRHNERLSSSDIELLEDWRKQLKDILQGVRRFTKDLRPPMLDDLGLVAAVEWLAGELKQTSGMHVDFKVIGTERRFRPEEELVLFRVIQEALANVRRHAEATVVEVTLEFAENTTTVVVRDNGKGFQLPKALGDLSRLGRLGLIGMEERARLLGGSIKVQSEIASGTTVTVTVPTSIHSI